LQGHTLNFDGPVYLSLVPWEFCNWACQYCHEEHRKLETGELTLDEMRRIIRQAPPMGIKALLLLGGEVLLRRTWSVTQAIVAEAFDNGLVTLIYTNGSELTQPMAEWLADHGVSLAFKLDSLQPEVYDRLSQRRGSFATTMRAIEIARQTAIGQVVCENETDQLVRLLFTTVGNSNNLEEYASLARFATNSGARWMMEALNCHGDAIKHPDLAVDLRAHSQAMRIAISLNPAQSHTFNQPCRLFSCVTIRKKGQIGVCPQDYQFVGNIRETDNLQTAYELVRNRVSGGRWREEWTGVCPIKSKSPAANKLLPANLAAASEAAGS